MAVAANRRPRATYENLKNGKSRVPALEPSGMHGRSSTGGTQEQPKSVHYNTGSFISTPRQERVITLSAKPSRPAISSPSDNDPISNAIRAQSNHTRNVGILDWLSKIEKSASPHHELTNEIPNTLDEVTYCLNGTGTVFDSEMAETDALEGVEDDWKVETAASEDSMLVLTGYCPEPTRNQTSMLAGTQRGDGIVPTDYYRHSVTAGSSSSRDTYIPTMALPPSMESRDERIFGSKDDRNSQGHEKKTGRLSKRPPAVKTERALHSVAEDDLETPSLGTLLPRQRFANSGDSTPVNHEKLVFPGGGESALGSRRNLELPIENDGRKMKDQQDRWWRKLKRFLLG